MSTFAFLDDAVVNDGMARITVFGVGGGGGNAVQHMVQSGITGVKFVCANTDRQALNRINVEHKIQLGEKSTRGLGAGADPDVGQAAAEESIDEIRAHLENTDMLFITAGMGGGTGTGAAPIIAKLSKEMGILTVAVVTIPFSFEGPLRAGVAEKGVKTLEEFVDSLVVIPNERLSKIYGKITMFNAYKKADDVLLNSVRNIFDLIIRPGYTNLDFADLRTAMSSRGYAMMGIGTGRGEDRARQSAEQAIRSPLLEGVTSMDAKSLIINITSSDDEEYGITMDEVEEINSIVRQITDYEHAHIFVGTGFDAELKDEIRVQIVATGLVRNILGDSATPIKKPLPKDDLVHIAPLREESVAEPVAPKIETPKEDFLTTNQNSPNTVSLQEFIKRRMNEK